MTFTETVAVSVGLQPDATADVGFAFPPGMFKKPPRVTLTSTEPRYTVLVADDAVTEHGLVFTVKNISDEQSTDPAPGVRIDADDAE